MNKKLNIEIDEDTVVALRLSLESFFESEYYCFQEYSEEAVAVSAKARKVYAHFGEYLGTDSSSYTEYLEKQVPKKLRAERLKALETNEHKTIK